MATLTANDIGRLDDKDAITYRGIVFFNVVNTTGNLAFLNNMEVLNITQVSGSQ